MRRRKFSVFTLLLELHIIYDNIYVLYPKISWKNKIPLNMYPECTFNIQFYFCFIKFLLSTNDMPTPNLPCNTCLTFVLLKSVVQLLTSISNGRSFFFHLLSSDTSEYFQCCWTTNSQNAILRDFVNYIYFKGGVGFVSSLHKILSVTAAPP